MSRKDIEKRVCLRFAQLTDEQKADVVNKVKQKLNGGNGSEDADADTDLDEAPEGEVIILEDEQGKTARSRKAIEFKTKKEFEEYKKTHDIDPHTKVKILEEQGGDTKQEEPSAKKPKPKAEPKEDKQPAKEEKTQKAPKKEDTGDKEKGEGGEAPKQTTPETMSVLKDLAETGGNDTARQIAVKDALIEKMGEEAAGWDAHKIDKSQLTKNVVIRFPDGTAKKFGDLTSEEQERVENAIESGMAASKGINDYNSVDAGTYKRNMAKNLAVYDDASVQEKTLESTEKVSPENAGKLASEISTNARSVIQKYSKAMSSVSRPMLENYVDTVSNAVREAVSDGSLVNVDEAAIDELVRDDVKRMVHQEIETRRRSLGDHGIRHATQNAVNTNSMLEELQKNGLPITGKDKLMAMTIQANHDNGYTVGDVATDITKGKMHKQYSADMAGQEMQRYAKIFGDDGAEQIKEIIASHDENKINWKDDSVGSAVRLSDATALFGKEKVQDLFIREPKAMELVCRLRLAAEAEPDNKELQDAIKQQMHETIDKSNFDDTDKDLLHKQVSEMSEGKFSTTVDILSRYSGRIDGFKYDPKKEIMSVNMKYSPEGQMVDTLFGDDVAAKQFGKFADDMDGEAVRGKKGKTMLKSDGKNAVELNIDGFDEDPINSASTEAMKEFAEKTIRDELNMARRTVLPPPEMIRKSVDEAFKYVEKVRDKFEDDEWEEMSKLFKKYKGDPEGLIQALKKFPLLKSEKEYLLAKTPGIELPGSGEAKAASIVARVAARGLQVKRKDKDLMSDTGGTSKVREREPEKKPPRDDMKKPHRTKDKPADQRDKDTDNDKDLKKSSVHPLDRKGQLLAGFDGLEGPEDNYYRRVWSGLTHIMANANGVSEKSFKAYDEIMAQADQLLRTHEAMEVVDRFEAQQKRPSFCAECLYDQINQTVSKVAKSFIAGIKKAGVKRLDEKDDLEREIKKAIQNGDTVEFEYTKADGSKKKREISPKVVFKMKGRPAVKGVEVNDRRGIEKLFYLDMIGDVSATEESRPEPKKKLSDQEKIEKVYEFLPDLKKYFGSNPYGKNKNRVIAIYIALSSGKALKYDIVVGEDVMMTEGPIGMMERSHFEGTKTYISIDSGKPWDIRRVDYREDDVDYWIDDEGNKSSGRSQSWSQGGYSKRTYRRW